MLLTAIMAIMVMEGRAVETAGCISRAEIFSQGEHGLQAMCCVQLLLSNNGSFSIMWPSAVFIPFFSSRVLRA